MAVTVSRVRYFQASGWPNASNTGVPAGTTLTPFSGDFATTSNGQIVQDLDVTGSVVVNHSNVTVRRCKVTASSFAVVYMSGRSGTIVEDCELSANWLEGSQALFEGNNVTGRRLNIYGVTDAAQIYEDTWEFHDNYMHDFAVGEPSHADGLQTVHGIGNVHIYHNTFDFRVGHAIGGGPAVDGGMSSGMHFEVLNPNLGEPNHDWLVENNRFLVLDSGAAPCAYTIRIPEQDCSPHATWGERNLRVINNRLTPGIFGYVQVPTGNITEWSGNVDDDTGLSVP